MSTSAVLRSEWIKIRTLRGTAWSLLAVFVLTAGFAVAANAAIGDSEADSADFDALHSVFVGLNLGQIAAIAFGTTAMSAEYQGGAIRASLTAVLRSGVAVLSILIPFILVVSMVLGEASGSLADYLPDRAGQRVL